MKRTVRHGACCIALFALVSGCSSPADRYAAEIKVGLKALNKLHASYKKVTEEGEFEGAKAEIGEAAVDAKEIKKRIDAAEPADSEIKEKVLKKYSPFMEAILLRLDSEYKRVSELAKKGEQNTVAVLAEYKTLTRPDKSKQIKK